MIGNKEESDGEENSVTKDAYQIFKDNVCNLVRLRK